MPAWGPEDLKGEVRRQGRHKQPTEYGQFQSGETGEATLMEIYYF